MTNREYIEIFEDIFWAVADELNITDWWTLFDSEQFEEVENRIAKAFDEADAADVPFFLGWYNEMAGDLWKQVFFICRRLVTIL